MCVLKRYGSLQLNLKRLDLYSLSIHYRQSFVIVMTYIFTESKNRK